MKKLSYIIFEEYGTTLVGFNKYNDPGFIDDGSKWSEKALDSFEETVVSGLGLTEVGSFTYEFSYSLESLEEQLQDLGITKMEKGWK